VFEGHAVTETHDLVVGCHLSKEMLRIRPEHSWPNAFASFLSISTVSLSFAEYFERIHHKSILFAG